MDVTELVEDAVGIVLVVTLLAPAEVLRKVDVDPLSEVVLALVDETTGMVVEIPLEPPGIPPEIPVETPPDTPAQVQPTSDMLPETPPEIPPEMPPEMSPEQLQSAPELVPTSLRVLRNCLCTDSGKRWIKLFMASLWLTASSLVGTGHGS